MKRVSFFLGLVVCIGVFVAASATPAFAQGETGSVTGVVTDPQGATVAGADVTLTDIATHSPRATTTNESGRYHFASVYVGLYDIMVTKSGFKTAKFSQQKISVGSVLTVNVSMEVGSLSETVVVTSAAAGTELQTANATIGNTFDLKHLELLPNLGRDASTLMALQPGITPAGQVAGAVGDQNTFTIDGGQNTDDMSGDTVGYIVNFTGTSGAQTNGMASGVVPTPIESIEEFRVNTFGQTADFNSSIGAQVQMVTKRGSDQWHGSGYGYYWTPNILGANSWKSNHTQFTKGNPPTPRACAAGTTLHQGDNNCIMPYTPIIPNQRKRFGFSLGGPMIPFKILGGKTYVFANYEGFRFGGVQTFERAYPTAAMRAGVIQVQNQTSSAITGLENGVSVSYPNGAFIPYNLNPVPVTVTIGNPSSTNSPLRTVTLAPCLRTATLQCDPRGFGVNSTIQAVWNTIPLPNDPLSGGDQFNTQGLLSTIRLPLTSNNYVGRIDHDFNSKERFFVSFRAEHLINTTSNQVDIGGLLPGTTRGQYTPTTPRVQTPELLVFGLTSTLSPTITNDLRLSYLWNWWQWGTANDPPQLAGLGGALEITAAGTGGNAEATTALIPYNVNNQSTRARFWDGQDKTIRDDVTWVKGNHLFQFGGLYQHNFDWHSRTDNGSTINNQIVYQIASQAISFTGFFPSNLTTNSTMRANYANLATSVLGLVGLTQVIYTRTGSNLAIQPIGTPAQERSVIKTYNAYFSDTWRMKPTLTLNYGLGYTVETPPVEQNGAQVELVDQSGALIHTNSFLAQRKAAALAGKAYAPILGFETTQNLHIKYPYNLFKGGISPRLSVAWNPQFKSGLLHKAFGDGNTVFRAGYGRIFGRLNGVNLVLVPLLGPGLLQPVVCSAPLAVPTSTFPNGCGSSVDVSTVFRIGRDGNTAPLPAGSATLPQPFLPGVNGPVAGDSTVLDPDYRPESTHNFDFTIQRSFGRKMSLEVGYIGRSIRNEFEEIDLDAVPYMMTLGGQSFAQAYASLYVAICGTGGTCANNAYTGPTQPFFEAALTPGTGYCATFSSCTAAVASKEASRFGSVRVSDIWANLNAGVGWTLGRTMLSDQATAINTTTSLGYGNYNAAFVTLRLHDWHGVTAISNFTWGKALGTGALTQRSSSNTWLDIWNAKANYGPATFDRKFIFNLGLTYRPDFFKGKKGILGQLVNGWSVSPFFTAESGLPIRVTYSGQGGCSSECQAFGQVGNSSSSSSAFEGALPIVPYTISASAHRGVIPTTGVGSNNAEGINMFTDPASVFAGFRRCILGIDTSCGGINNLRGLNRWNLDATLAKDIKFTERVGATFTMQFSNVMNHFQPSNPSSLALTSSSSFGRITSAVYEPRQVEFGLRIHF